MFKFMHFGRNRFHIGNDDTLIFSAEQSGRKRRKLQIVVDDYVTNGAGGQKQIEIFADGTVQVRSDGR